MHRKLADLIILNPQFFPKWVPPLIMLFVRMGLTLIRKHVNGIQGTLREDQRRKF